MDTSGRSGLSGQSGRRGPLVGRFGETAIGRDELLLIRKTASATIRGAETKSGRAGAHPYRALSIASALSTISWMGQRRPIPS